MFAKYVAAAKAVMFQSMRRYGRAAGGARRANSAVAGANSRESPLPQPRPRCLR